MRSLKKLLIILIAILLIGTLVIPTMAIILEKSNITGSSILSFLDMITDNTIVEASDTDYGYSGNLYLRHNFAKYDDAYLDHIDGLHVYTASAGVEMEYSVNNGQYQECEYFYYGSDILNLDKEINTVSVKHVPTGIIILESVVKKYKDAYIDIEKTKVGWGSGSKIRIQGYEQITQIEELNLEYSIDNGATFEKIDQYTTYLPSLYEDILIIREMDTQEILYKSPEKEEVAPGLEEEYIYENGRTTLRFKLPEGIDAQNAQYSYVINGEEYTGNEVIVEDDTDIKLKVTNTKEFMTYSAEKDVTAAVAKTEKPSIEQTGDNTFKLNPGEITNDTLGKMYYIIDDGEENEYIDEFEVSAGTHIIKAYQVSEDKNIKSEEIEQEVTIEEKQNEEPENQNENEPNENEPNENEQNENENSQNEENENENEHNQDEESKDNENKEEENSEEENKDDSNNKTQEENNDYNKNAKQENNKKQENIKTNENKDKKTKSITDITPKTGDSIITFVAITFIIILMNLFIRKKIKKGKRMK